MAERIKLRGYRLLGRRIVHLLHIGKTGGSAVKYALRQHLVGDEFVIVPHPHEVALADVPAGDSVVFFLRDPVSRFQSGFYSRQRQGQPRYHAPWSEAERRAFECFATPNDLAVAITSSDDERRRAAERAMADIAHVRDSYARWLGDESYLRSRTADILFIGVQEHLSDDFERLKTLLGLPAEIRLPDDDVLAHRNPQDVSEPLTPQAIENLRHWYETDYQLLRVCEQLAGAPSA